MWPLEARISGLPWLVFSNSTHFPADCIFLDGWINPIICTQLFSLHKLILATSVKSIALLQTKTKSKSCHEHFLVLNTCSAQQVPFSLWQLPRPAHPHSFLAWALAVAVSLLTPSLHLFSAPQWCDKMGLLSWLKSKYLAARTVANVTAWLSPPVSLKKPEGWQIPVTPVAQAWSKKGQQGRWILGAHWLVRKDKMESSQGSHPMWTPHMYTHLRRRKDWFGLTVYRSHGLLPSDMATPSLWTKHMVEESCHFRVFGKHTEMGRSQSPVSVSRPHPQWPNFLLLRPYLQKVVLPPYVTGY